MFVCIYFDHYFTFQEYKRKSCLIDDNVKRIRLQIEHEEVSLKNEVGM